VQGQSSQPLLIGAFISLCVAVPIGPVALACIRRTLACGLGPRVLALRSPSDQQSFGCRTRDREIDQDD
jgi:hypothetical protein